VKNRRYVILPPNPLSPPPFIIISSFFLLYIFLFTLFLCAIFSSIRDLDRPRGGGLRDLFQAACAAAAAATEMDFLG
jgi:hypothetical protein